MKILTCCAMLLVLACSATTATPANRLFSDAELIAAYAGRPSMFVTIDGVRIHYRDEGRGPTLVLINGHLGSLHMWDAWVERLRDRFRIVRLDFPPYGLSGPDPENLYSSQRAAVLVGRFLDHLGLARVHIGGTSNGALVAVLFAIDNPQRVDRLVVSTLPAGRPPARTPSPALIAAATADRATAPVQSRAFYEAFLRDIIANDAVIDAALIDRYWKLNNRVGARAAESIYIQAQYRFWDSTDVPALYARLRRPLLLQWGADGVVLPEQIGRDVAALLPNAPVTLIQYRGAGHLPMLEKPDETARDAAAFLTETRSSQQ
jgi:pimeloyl-ACP methyl ester carboxylesterase